MGGQNNNRIVPPRLFRGDGEFSDTVALTRRNLFARFPAMGEEWHRTLLRSVGQPGLLQTTITTQILC
jgi:hypothetical protein